MTPAEKIELLPETAPATPESTATRPDPKTPGPKTEAGKKRSSQNSFKHGLAGRTVVMPGEDMSLFLAHSKRIVDGFNPQTPVEHELAQTIAGGYWRMNRARTVEEGMFAWGNYEEAGNFDAENEAIHTAFTAAKVFRTNSQAFVNLTTYEGRIQRGIEKATKQLKELQAERRARRTAEILEAIRMRNYHRMLQSQERVREAWEPAADGFVYSAEEIDQEARRLDRQKAAHHAEKAGFRYPEFLKQAA